MCIVIILYLAKKCFVFRKRSRVCVKANAKQATDMIFVQTNWVRSRFAWWLHHVTNVDHRILNQLISFNSLGTTIQYVRMRMSNLLHNVNTYESPHWHLSLSDITLRLDLREDVWSGLYNGFYCNWSVATNLCSIHLWPCVNENVWTGVHSHILDM